MAVKEFFIHGATFAAPFVSEEVTRYGQAETPEAAVEALVAEYGGGVGIYAANAYATADDYHKGCEPLAKWRSNKALTTEQALGSGKMMRSDSEGTLLVGDELRTIDDPRGGRFV